MAKIKTSERYTKKERASFQKKWLSKGNNRQKNNYYLAKRKRIIKEFNTYELNKLKSQTGCFYCHSRDFRVLSVMEGGRIRATRLMTMVNNGCLWETIKNYIKDKKIVCANCFLIKRYENKITQK